MSSTKRSRSPSASSVDPSTSKVPRTTTYNPGHSQKDKDHILVNDPTSPPSYISVGQTRLKVHDGHFNKARTRICREFSVLSTSQYLHLILKIASCMVEPAQTITYIPPRFFADPSSHFRLPAVAVCSRLYYPTGSWERDHAYAETPEQCYRKIQRIVHGMVDDILEIMSDEMTDYQYAFHLWLDATTQLIFLAQRIDRRGRQTGATKFGRDLADLGAGRMVMDRLSSFLPSLMVFEYSPIRNFVLGVLRSKFSPTWPFKAITPFLPPEFATYPNVWVDFDAIRAQWKARGVEIEQEKADAARTRDSENGQK